MPRSYPGEFRRKVLDLVGAGRPVAEVAEQLGVAGQTIYNWRNQDLIDRGIRPGVTTAESVDLAATRRRIRELETELAVTKRANELLREQIDPRRRFEAVAAVVSDDYPVEVACRAHDALVTPAASSLDTPRAIASQNRTRSSRHTVEGRPGDHI